jgi:hypothetical protein
MVKYRVLITKTTEDKAILVGFCTDSVLGIINNFQQRESAYYNCNGYFLEGGRGVGGLSATGAGGMIECEADLKAGVLRWSKNGNLFKDCAVPQKMRGKAVFLSILMRDGGEEVEVSV